MSGSDFLTNRVLSRNDMPPLETSVSASEFTVQFWGVRGGIPTPGLETVRYGGNTSCIEIRAGGKRLIFDGGTGLRVLGKRLLYEMPVQGHLFFTHTHWDRIQGFPFFAPAFIEGNHFDIYGAIGANGASIKQRLCDQMLRPNFSVPLQAMRSNLCFHDIAPGSVITLDDVVIETISLNRPHGALGYRVTWNGHSVVYATDTEHSAGHVNQALLYLANQADLLIYDAAYAEYSYYDPNAIALHSPGTWCAGVVAASAVQAKQVVLFHHDPAYEDDLLDRMEIEMQEAFSGARFARESMVIQVIPAASHSPTSHTPTSHSDSASRPIPKSSSL